MEKQYSRPSQRLDTLREVSSMIETKAKLRTFIRPKFPILPLKNIQATDLIYQEASSRGAWGKPYKTNSAELTVRIFTVRVCTHLSISMGNAHPLPEGCLHLHLESMHLLLGICPHFYILTWDVYSHILPWTCFFILTSFSLYFLNKLNLLHYLPCSWNSLL